MGAAFLEILLLDIAFLAICVIAIAPLVAYKKAAFAVLKRNFVGYFSNPTGYVFLCLFVSLTSFAAFWPHDFFTANLANLDQLNNYLPYIMLVFIPAITMSIWAEERRQGTDELLLTLPAGDFDIVAGKYLAAAAIFTASLVFSQFSNYVVLAALSRGALDTGLLFSTYLGYWLMGLAMLAIGMIASFLTSNMTVGFILGAVFNAPLAWAGSADLIANARWTQWISFWSLADNFDDLGRGVISLSSLLYFALVAVIGLYISMVLIGSRHWAGRGGPWAFAHYVLRALCLVGILAFVVLLFTDHDFVRYDATQGKVSSLSPKTKELIRNLDNEHPIVIDAFISGQVPEAYAQTKYNLTSLLKEFDAMSGGDIQVKWHTNLEPFSEEAAIAEERFGIQPTMVRTQKRGAFTDEEVILGAAFSSGLDKVVVPFFDYGIPVEYELVRSIGTVAQNKRKTLGVVRTDVQLFGGFSFAGGMPQQIPREAIIDELEKQYDVEEVDPTNPIEVDKYDVLLAVQPSSLGPQQLPNLVAAIEAGIPTAIFEDPQPVYIRAPGTGEPKQAPGGGMFGGGQQPMPKGNIGELWRTIGIAPPMEPSFHGGVSPDICWQDYNPYPKLQIRGLPNTWVFCSNDAPRADNAVNEEDPVTAGLTEILFLVPGVIEAAPSSEFKLTPLCKTCDAAGTLTFQQFRDNQQDPEGLSRAQGRPTGEKILAARIEEVVSGSSNDDEGEDSEGDDESSDDAPPAKRPLNVIYVADIDVMFSAFVRIRARPDDADGVQWRFENVNFLLNAIDSLAGEDRYTEIRRRKPFHSTLQVVEEKVQAQHESAEVARRELEQAYETEEQDLDKRIDEELTDAQEELKKLQEEGAEREKILAVQQRLQLTRRRLETEKEVTLERLRRETNQKVEDARRNADLEILKIQNFYKFLAVVLPPILPLLVGIIVFVSRRLREREGIVKARLHLT